MECKGSLRNCASTQILSFKMLLEHIGCTIDLLESCSARKAGPEGREGMKRKRAQRERAEEAGQCVQDAREGVSAVGEAHVEGEEPARWVIKPTAEQVLARISREHDQACMPRLSVDEFLCNLRNLSSVEDDLAKQVRVAAGGRG